MSRITMNNYELDTFTPAHRLSPNRRLAASSSIQCHQDYTYIQVPHSDTSKSDTLSLLSNCGPRSASVPLLDSQQSQVATNRWRTTSDDHRTFKHKRKVTSRGLIERLLGVAKLSALFILASAYLGFCVVAQKHLISLKSNKFHAFTPDNIG